MRGSISIKRMSETRVPMTVIAPMNTTMVPGQVHVLLLQRLEEERANRRQAQHHRYYDAPRYEIGEHVSNGADEGVQRHPNRVLQHQPPLGRPLGPGRDHVRLMQLVQHVGPHDPDERRRAGRAQDEGRYPEVVQQIEPLGYAPGRLDVLGRE